MERADLDRKMEEYQKQKKLQDSIIALEREHQMEQLELQKQAAGIQAAAAAESAEYAKNMEVVSTLGEEIAGTAKTIVENDPKSTLRILDQVMVNTGKVDKATLVNLNTAVSSMGKNSAGIEMVRSMIVALNTLNPDKIKWLIMLINSIKD